MGFKGEAPPCSLEIIDPKMSVAVLVMNLIKSTVGRAVQMLYSPQMAI